MHALSVSVYITISVLSALSALASNWIVGVDDLKNLQFFTILKHIAFCNKSVSFGWAFLLFHFSSIGNIYSVDDEWIPANGVASTKRVKLGSLRPEVRSAILAELFDKKFETFSTARKGRKTKPQPRLSAISWHPDFLRLVPRADLPDWASSN